MSSPDRIQLGDGQHRWFAQVASGTEQTYRHRIFTDEDEFALFVRTRDSGKPRTLADLLRILGVVEGSTAAATFERVNNAMQVFLGIVPSRLSRQERLDFAFKRAKEIRYVLGLPQRRFRAHTLAAVAFAYGKQAKPVDEFMTRVTEGANLPEKSPALELGKALPDLNGVTGTRERDRAIALVFRAIHDGIRGKRTTTIHSLLRTDNSPIVEAITEFTNVIMAKAWVERNRSGRK